MIIERLGNSELILLTPRRFEDARGFFSETYSQTTLAVRGVTTVFVQDNLSYSARAGTLRGLHYQMPPRAQAKLVRCSRGAIRDVAVDVRRGSPNYGRWEAVELTGDNGRQLLIPAGFLHGFVTLTDDTEVQYKCSDTYAPDCDGAVRWDSAGVDWGLNDSPILSAKDSAAQPFSDWQSPFVWECRA